MLATATGETFLSPLRTALEIGTTGSVHDWSRMRTACLELVERYGDHSIQWNINQESRLKIAVLYLGLGIKIGIQLSRVSKDILGLCGDASFVSGVSKELLELMTSVSSSSAEITSNGGENDNNAMAGAVSTKASASATKGKGSKASAGNSNAGNNGPSGRDALFLLMATQRECDPLWGDGYERELWSDLHALLKRDCAAYESQCCVHELPQVEGTAAASTISLSVSAASISTSYSPCKAPVGFVVSPDWLVSDTGLFSHVAVYFLLGPKKTIPLVVVPVDVKGGKKQPPAAAAAAGAAALALASTTEPTAEPVLTKLMLYRAHVILVEKEIRSIRQALDIAGKNNWTHMEQQCGNRLGLILIQLQSLLKVGYIPSPANSTHGAPSSVIDVNTIKKQFEICSPNDTVTCNHVKMKIADVSCTIPVNDSCLSALADVFSHDKDTDAAVDNDICVFLRVSLGYIDDY